MAQALSPGNVTPACAHIRPTARSSASPFITAWVSKVPPCQWATAVSATDGALSGLGWEWMPAYQFGQLFQPTQREQTVEQATLVHHGQLALAQQLLQPALDGSADGDPTSCRAG